MSIKNQFEFQTLRSFDGTRMRSTSVDSNINVAIETDIRDDNCNCHNNDIEYSIDIDESDQYDVPLKLQDDVEIDGI